MKIAKSHDYVGNYESQEICSEYVAADVDVAMLMTMMIVAMVVMVTVMMGMLMMVTVMMVTEVPMITTRNMTMIMMMT